MSGIERRVASALFAALVVLAPARHGHAQDKDAPAKDEARDKDETHAKDPRENDRALAQSLFEDALRLMERGEYRAACPMLARSQELDPASGTALDLGYCFEQVGDVTRASAAYEAARRYAVVDRRADREEAARTKLAELGKSRVAERARETTEPAPPAAREGRGNRTAAWATGIAGATLVVAGGLSGLAAMNAHADVEAGCDGMRCSADANDAEERASAFAWGANIGIGLGLVALGASAYFFLTSTKASVVASARTIGVRF